VVGPTKRKPAFFSALASAAASATWAGTSAKLAGAARAGGRWAHTISFSGVPASRRSTVARALAIVASILARLRTIPASPSSRSTSSGPKRAIASGSKPAKAARKASRLRRMVSQDSPDWKASSETRSKRPRSSVTGWPHSSSW
jgi:hypothetical protein